MKEIVQKLIEIEKETSTEKGVDVSWIAKDRWESIPEADRKVFTHTYPDFAVEIRSESDRLKDLQANGRPSLRRAVPIANRG